MTMHVRDAGTWKQVTALSVRDGGTWKPVVAGYVKDAGAWKQFYAAAGGGGGGGDAALTLDPDPAYELRVLPNFNSSGYVNVDIVATPSGFGGTVTYLWTRVSGASGAGAFSATGTTSATVNIGATVPCFQDWTETWRCTATDGTDTVSVDVVVTLRCENLS